MFRMTTPKNLKQRKEKRQRKQRRKELFISINIEPSLINEGFVVYNKIFISTLTPTPLPSRERGKTYVCFTVLSNQGRGEIFFSIAS